MTDTLFTKDGVSTDRLLAEADTSARPTGNMCGRFKLPTYSMPKNQRKHFTIQHLTYFYFIYLIISFCCYCCLWISLGTNPGSCFNLPLLLSVYCYADDVQLHLHVKREELSL